MLDFKPQTINLTLTTFSEMEEGGKGEEDPAEKNQDDDQFDKTGTSWTREDSHVEDKEPAEVGGGAGRKTGSGQRSVAFHLGEEHQGGAQVGRGDSDGSEGRSDGNGEETNSMMTNNNEKPQMRKESVGTAVKKEIIGILKPPNPRKELKSFPSLPECFLHDLGLIENIALE